MLGRNFFLQLRVRDKFFFLLVALLTIGGLYAGARHFFGETSTSVKEHAGEFQQEAKGIKRSVRQLSEEAKKVGHNLGKVAQVGRDMHADLRKSCIGKNPSPQLQKLFDQEGAVGVVNHMVNVALIKGTAAVGCVGLFCVWLRS